MFGFTLDTMPSSVDSQAVKVRRSNKTFRLVKFPIKQLLLNLSALMVREIRGSLRGQSNH